MSYRIALLTEKYTAGPGLLGAALRLLTHFTQDTKQPLDGNGSTSRVIGITVSDQTGHSF